VAAAVLTAFSIVIDHSDIAVSSFVKDNVLAIFTRGALGAALWAVVMWTGALPNGSAAIKKLMPIRGELSITAAIITFSHIVRKHPVNHDHQKNIYTFIIHRLHHS